MNYKKLLKEARNQLVLYTLLDKSGQCKEMVEKIDATFGLEAKQIVCDHHWIPSCAEHKICIECDATKTVET